MKKINATQLSFILGIKKKDAANKIKAAIARANGNIEDTITLGEEEFKEKDPSIEIDKLSKHTGIDFEFYISDIKKNYLNNSATRGFILNYPTTKLKPSKKTGQMPKKVSIPSVLKSFLTEGQKRSIVDGWKDKYSTYVNLGVKFTI